MIREVLMPVLSIALSLLAAASFLTYLALNKIRKQMSEEMHEPDTSGLTRHPWRIYRKYNNLHAGSMLSRCYALLNVSFLLLALGIGAVGFCFGKLTSL